MTINPFCYIKIHNWVYRKEKHPVENHPNNREFIRIVVRECQWCGHREYHSLPRNNRKFDKWLNFDDIKENDKVNYDKLY